MDGLDLIEVYSVTEQEIEADFRNPTYGLLPRALVPKMHQWLLDNDFDPDREIQVVKSANPPGGYWFQQ